MWLPQALIPFLHIGIDGLADGRRGVRCDECAKDDGMR